MTKNVKNYPIPVDPFPEDYKCVQVLVPNNSLYVSEFFEAYSYFTKWVAWPRGNNNIGARVADVVQAPMTATIANAPELIAARAILARATADNIPSPCISVCRMSELTGLCEGCYRTLDEIRDWSSADDSAKRAIWQRIEQRLAASPS